MGIELGLGSLAALAGLALVDSTSFGTLLIPVWLLMSPGRVRLGRIMLFLGTVAGAYFAIGLALMFGATALAQNYDHLVDAGWFLFAQLVLGVALFALSFAMDSKRSRARAAANSAAGQGRLTSWRRRIVGGDGRSGSIMALMALALTAVFIEAASMLPYLAGIGIIAAEGPGMPGNGLILAGYCVVMIAPALLLTCVRVVASAAVEAPLARLDKWLTKNAQSTTAWIIGILGFILAANALNQLLN